MLLLSGGFQQLDHRILLRHIYFEKVDMLFLLLNSFCLFAYFGGHLGILFAAFIREFSLFLGIVFGEGHFQLQLFDFFE